MASSRLQAQAVVHSLRGEHPRLKRDGRAGALVNWPGTPRATAQRENPSLRHVGNRSLGRRGVSGDLRTLCAGNARGDLDLIPNARWGADVAIKWPTPGRQTEHEADANHHWASLRGADAYALGRSEAETRRLMLQHRIYGPLTRRFFEAAGIGAGMQVLDIGSGAGDVALLLADIVGPSGRVVGIDTNAEILETARARVDAAGLSNVTFKAGDVMNAGLPLSLIHI